MICLKCHEKETTINNVIGALPYCDDCQSTLQAVKSKIPEFTSEQIKEGRRMYSKDIIQPHRKGELSKEWLESGTNRVERAKQMGFSEREIKNAKYVWSGDDTYYKKY